MNTQQIVNDLVIIAEEAGAYIMQFYGKVEDVGKAVGETYDCKKDELKTSLTYADIHCQELILLRLLDKYSKFGVLSEENSEEIVTLERNFCHRDTLMDGKYTFLIDPIDGTTNFLNTNAHNFEKKGDPMNKDRFGVQITLMFGEKVIGGVAHLPRLKKTIATVQGGQTTINDRVINLTKKVFDRNNPIRIGFFIDKKYMGIDREDLCALFPNRVSFGASCYTCYSLLSQEIDAWLLNRTELLDFGFTALAYQNAGGFVGGEDSLAISVSDLIQRTKNGIELIGFMLLAPDGSYHRELIRYISH
ncbi:MAG: inositol monophosphatase family protein [Candidatus Peribacteraceae bacterium]|jgi:fructose-1,6-bisphosphatase/inositol monophosphatase family enzyme